MRALWSHETLLTSPIIWSMRRIVQRWRSELEAVVQVPKLSARALTRSYAML